jgi:hypothetical protein
LYGLGLYGVYGGVSWYMLALRQYCGGEISLKATGE